MRQTKLKMQEWVKIEEKIELRLVKRMMIQNCSKKLGSRLRGQRMMLMRKGVLQIKRREQPTREAMIQHREKRGSASSSDGMTRAFERCLALVA